MADIRYIEKFVVKYGDRVSFPRYICHLLLAGLLLANLCGCRTPSQHRKAADKAVAGIVDEYQRKALGTNVAFTIERPSTILRNRLIVEQGLPISTNLYVDMPDASVPAMRSPLPLSLNDMLTVAARNSREYQAEKEKVFQAALALDLNRDSYRNTFSAIFSSGISSSDTDSERTENVSQDGAVSDTGSKTTEKVTHAGSVGMTRALQSGATLSTKIAVDLVNLLTGDKSSAMGLLADVSVSIPLLRGAGKAIAREPLTQAERDVIYAIWRLERFKRSFAVDITDASLAVLRRIEEVKNTEGNYGRIQRTRARAERLGEAGRLDNIQVDQAKQNELRAKNQLVAVKQSLESSLDALKVKLGLPVDAKIMLDSGELQALADKLSEAIAADRGEFTDEEISALVQRALAQRLDMRIAINRLEDSERMVAVAEDDLRADVKLKGGASLKETEKDDGTTSTKVEYTGMLEVDLPWEKSRERTQYRQSLIALEAARRAAEAQEDKVKASVRDAVRRRQEALEAYMIQIQARSLAERRVKSVNLFQEAGRATVRDALEAQESLLAAQNAALSSLVDCQLLTLALLRDLELLEVDSELKIKDRIGADSIGRPTGRIKHEED
jgi:outer membrane protein TolC